MDTYKKAKEIRPGHSVCNAGYEDCPGADSYHWHCEKCGGISGQQGHYSKLPGQTEWQFNCPSEGGTE